MENSNNISNIKNSKNTFNFLNETYDVMKCFENNPSKLSNKINELKSKFEKARQILATVSGIDLSQTEQQVYYEQLLKQYNREHELLMSYKEMCKFDLTQLEQQPDDLTIRKKIEEDSKKLDKTNAILTSHTDAVIEMESSVSVSTTANNQETK